MIKINALANRSFNQGIFTVALLVFCGLIISSCSLLKQPSSYEEVFEITLELPEQPLRPSEALLVEVQVKNVASDSLNARHLNADSVDFLWWTEDTMNRVKQKPVFSPKEDLSLTTEIAPGKILTRKFLFTTVTPDAGTYYIQGIYASPHECKNVSPMIVSLPAQYKVEGVPLFSRGEDGLIYKDDAIHVAKDYIGRPTLREHAQLIKNEAGFHEWWVTLELPAEVLAKGERAYRGFFVNAYTGAIRKEAKRDFSIFQDVERNAVP